MDFDQFKSQWLGHIIDFDHVYGYQCVDLILQYVYECFGINSGVSGNAIDYWVKTGINGFNQNLLSKFTKVASSDAEKGDIVVLNGLAGNPFGHIGIATGNINATEVEMLEQNGADGNGSGQGGDVIRTRYIDRTRVAGLLRPTAAPSSPTPAAATPAGDTVILPASVASWAVYKPGSALRKGTSDQIGALAPAREGGLSYHIDGWVGNYAVNIRTQDFGEVTIWVKDTSAQFSNSAPAAPAAPPPPPPTPVNPNPAPPAAPLQAPSSETYDIVAEVTGYTTSNQAINHAPVTKTVQIPVGTYFLFNKRFVDNTKTILALNITKTPGTAGAWINPDDNHLPLPEPPVPAEPEAAPVAADVTPTEPDFAGTYKPLVDAAGDAKAQVYVAMKDLTVTDLQGLHKDAQMPKYSVTYISGTFIVNGVEYARPKSAVDKGWWYGIAWVDRETNVANLELEADVFSGKTTLADRQAIHRTTLKDNLLLAVSHAKKIIVGITGFLGKIKPAKKTK